MKNKYLIASIFSFAVLAYAASPAVADHKTGVTLRVIANAIAAGKVDPDRPHMPAFKDNVCRSCHAMSEEREQKIRETQKSHPGLQDADAWCLACHNGSLAKLVPDNHKKTSIGKLGCIDEEEMTQPSNDAADPNDKPRLTACSSCHDIHQTKDGTALIRPSIQSCSQEASKPTH